MTSLAEEAKRLRDSESALKIDASTNVLKGEKLLWTRSNQKEAELVSNVEQVLVDFYAWSSRVAILVVCATEMESQLKQSTSQERAAESIYSLLYDESQALKQLLATGVFCKQKMEQGLINASKHVLGYMDAPNLKAVWS